MSSKSQPVVNYLELMGVSLNSTLPETERAQLEAGLTTLIASMPSTEEVTSEDDIVTLIHRIETPAISEDGIEMRSIFEVRMPHLSELEQEEQRVAYQCIYGEL